MFRSWRDNWWRSPEGVLTRLEGLALRGWLRAAMRDPRFGLSILVVAFVVVAAIVRGGQLMAARPDAGLCAAGVLGFFLYRSSRIAPGSKRWVALQGGVLQPWTAFGPVLKRWALGRAVVMTAGGSLVMAAIVAVTQPQLGWACLGSLWAGAVMAAVTAGLRLPRLRRAPVRLRIALPVPAAVRVSLAGTFRRKVGFAPVWLLCGGAWALATPASALATHNTPEAPIGFAMITVVGLICALGLAWPNLRLIRFLAFQPIPLRRIVAVVCGPQVAIVAVAAIAAGFGAGQSPGLAMVSAAVVTGAVCLWLALLIPYAMTRSVTMAPVMAIGELFVAAIVKFSMQFGLIAVGWLVVRIVANIRAVPRHRWKEPL